MRTLCLLTLLQSGAFQIQEVLVYLVKTKERGKGWGRNKGKELQAPVTYDSTEGHLLEKINIYGKKTGCINCLCVFKIRKELIFAPL
jgi:hypothetical protein